MGEMFYGQLNSYPLIVIRGEHVFKICTSWASKRYQSSQAVEQKVPDTRRGRST